MGWEACGLLVMCGERRMFCAGNLKHRFSDLPRISLEMPVKPHLISLFLLHCTCKHVSTAFDLVAFKVQKTS